MGLALCARDNEARSKVLLSCSSSSVQKQRTQGKPQPFPSLSTWPMYNGFHVALSSCLLVQA